MRHPTLQHSVCAADMARLTALASGAREPQGSERRVAASDLASQKELERIAFCQCLRARLRPPCLLVILETFLGCYHPHPEGEETDTEM